MISVVIPAYNRGPLLKRAVDSALAQTVPPAEVIVVDDGSTDTTKDICAAYGNHIRYVWQKNSGASVARNTGVIQASSEWVAFLDSDDYWTLEHLARMERAIKETKGQAVYYFSDMRMGPREDEITLWQKINFKPTRTVHLVEDGSNWAFLAYQPTMLQCAVFNKKIWLENQGLDARYRLMHDTELFLRLGIGRKICAVAGAGCVQTSDDVSNVRLTTAVNGKGAAYWEETVLMWRELLRQFPHMGAQYRRLAKHHLASAHWRLFRLRSSGKNFGKAFSQIPKVIFADPRFAVSLVAKGRADQEIPPISPEYN